MPVSISQILDLLLALVLVLFIPIGVWRGALREWIALAGITFGLLLAGTWAQPWGGDIAVAFGWDRKLAAFAVAALFFLGTTLIVGYGGGITLPFRPDLTWTNRLLGAALSFGNGLLILGGILGIMQRHLFDERAGSPLMASGLATFLIGDIGWAYLGILAVLACCILIGLGRRWGGESPLMEEYGPVYRTIPRNTWSSPDAWDDPTPAPGAAVTTAPTTSEPIFPAAPAAPPASSASQETAVLKIVPPPAAGTQPGAGKVPPVVAAPAPDDQRLRRVVALARPAARPDEQEGTPRPANVTPLAPRAEAREAARGATGPEGAPASPPSDADQAPTVPPRPATNDEAGATCAVCGTLAAPRAHFCLNCGHIIGTPERRHVARQN